MRTKNYKLLNGTAIMAAILCSVQIVWLVMQSWFISGLGGVDGEINWDWVEENMLPYYPLGVYKDKSAGKGE